MLEKNPVLDELIGMKKRMETLYSESLLEGESGRDSGASEGPPWEPATDIWETEMEWVYAFDLPGVDESDLLVLIQEGQLVIDGKRRNSLEGLGPKIVRLERPVGSFRCSFALPADCRTDAMRAELKKGVLIVIVPKAQGSFRKIEVQPR